MGILHECLVAIGVALTVMIGCSLAVMGQEYLRTGHASLAVFEKFHWASPVDPCNEASPYHR